VGGETILHIAGAAVSRHRGGHKGENLQFWEGLLETTARGWGPVLVQTLLYGKSFQSKTMRKRGGLHEDLVQLMPIRDEKKKGKKAKLTPMGNSFMYPSELRRGENQRGPF